MRITRTGTIAAVAAGAALVASALVAPSAAGAAGTPATDPFYRYSGRTPLAHIKPGTALKTRTVSYSVQGVSLPLTAVQVLFRTRNQVGQPTVGVTTVVKPPVAIGRPKVVSYESFYDSLNPADEPSAAIAGGRGFGDGAANAETAVFAPALLAGYSVNIPDTEGQTADFAAGPEYGYVTLDSLRAISRTSTTGVGAAPEVGLLGYSGGAIAAEWAAELAKTYAPDVARRIVGTAIGGVLVEPGHNVHYIDGSSVWAGVMPMAVIGVARAFHVSFAKYLSAYGAKVYARLAHASISQALGSYPGLTWAKLVKPRYDKPEKVALFVKLANMLIMGRTGTPSAPLFVGQGDGGYLEGTRPGGPGIGAGDGVMIAGDVRSLAREYCARGVRVQYTQYPTSHFTSVPLFLPAAYAWLVSRFGGAVAPSSCGSIPAGNSLAPIKAIR